MKRNVFFFVVLVALAQAPISIALSSPASSGVTCTSTAATQCKIEQKSWDYKGHHIGYEIASSAGNGMPITREPVLLLNGFGVGSFHQQRLMPELFSDDRVVYGVDYLGQGRSWPVDCDDGESENEKGLIYSADTWIDQLIQFMEEVIIPQQDFPPQKIHLVGNSVGGYLSVILAVRRPDLLASISLLNATPVWGLNLPGWDGVLPAPSVPKWIGRKAFDWIRDLGTIDKYLETAYSNKAGYDENLMQQIRGCTEGKGGHAAFASIMWSPPATINPNGESQDFFQNLKNVQCDVLLIFGEDDPWCTPAFAKKMIQKFCQRQGDAVCRYIQLSNVGHCPNHEAPRAVAKAVSAWIDDEKRDAENLTLIKGTEEIREEWAIVYAKEMQEEDIELSLIDFLAVTFV